MLNRSKAGRKRKRDEDLRYKEIKVRVTEQEHRIIKLMATKNKEQMAVMLRRLAMEQYRREIDLC